MANGIVEGIKGTAAVAVTNAPTEVVPGYLATHGIGVLSWASIFQILGAVYVFCLLVKMFSNSSIGKKIKERIKKWLDK